MPEIAGKGEDLPVLCAVIPCFSISLYQKFPNCLGCGGHSECCQSLLSFVNIVSVSLE